MARTKQLIIPKFGSEREDAKWHRRHKGALESAMERRIKEGSAVSLREIMERAKLRPVTIRLATEDIETARGLAARKGLGYQTYIKLLLREALQRETGRR